MLRALMHAASGGLHAGRVTDADAERALVDTIVGALSGAGGDRCGLATRRAPRTEIG
jgi:hypothetical protein